MLWLWDDKGYFFTFVFRFFRCVQLQSSGGNSSTYIDLYMDQKYICQAKQ